jgi:hypothetical protein
LIPISIPFQVPFSQNLIYTFQQTQIYQLKFKFLNNNKQQSNTLKMGNILEAEENVEAANRNNGDDGEGNDGGGGGGGGGSGADVLQFLGNWIWRGKRIKFGGRKRGIKQMTD